MKPLRDSHVCVDNNRHTCIELYRSSGFVSYIPLSYDGFEVQKLSEASFDSEYTVLMDYPVSKAARLFTEYAQHLGATLEAMKELAVFTPVTEKEIEMATAKKTASNEKKAGAPKAPPAKTPAAKKAPVAKKAGAPKAVPAKAPAAKKTVSDEKKVVAPKAVKKVVVKPATSSKPSASSRFKELILTGDFTDDQIFAKVKKEFDLDDNKRSYVGWYRAAMIRAGVKVPPKK